MITLPILKVRNSARFFIKNKIPFTCEITMSRVTIKSKYGNFTSNNQHFPAQELNFIKQVKKHVLDNFKSTAFKRRACAPKYFAYSKQLKKNDCFNNVYLVDLKSAYWQTAHNIGVIDKAIYEKGLLVSKKTRLAAIGTLAKKVSVYQFDGEKELFIEEKIAETEQLWDVICTKVGEILTTAAKSAKNNFIFFWVDGIYVKDKKSATEVAKIFKKAGYSCTTEKIQRLDITEQHILVKTGKMKTKTIEGKKQMTDIKRFHYSATKNRI